MSTSDAKEVVLSLHTACQDMYNYSDAASLAQTTHSDLLRSYVAGWAMPFIDFLNEGDFCGTLLLAGFVFFVGSKFAERNASIQQAGYRLAAVAFLAYCLLSIAVRSPSTPEEFLAIGFRGLLAAGLVAGTAWMTLPVLSFLYRHTLGALIDRVRSWRYLAQRRRAERKYRQEEERRQRAATEEYERGAPRREQLEREADARAQRENAAQKRRDDARAQCEILYSLYAPDIKERFDRQSFTDFIAKYMDDQRSAEYVEERAAQLQSLLQRHYEKVDPGPAFQSLSEIARWFIVQKEQIEKLPDDRLKRMLLVRLNERYAELTARFLEEANP